MVYQQSKFYVNARDVSEYLLTLNSNDYQKVGFGLTYFKLARTKLRHYNKLCVKVSTDFLTKLINN